MDVLEKANHKLLVSINAEIIAIRNNITEIRKEIIKLNKIEEELKRGKNIEGWWFIQK